MNNQKNQRFKVVLTGAIITGAGVGFFSNCAGVFITPVCNSLGFSRGAFAMTGSISIIASILMLPLFGRLLQTADIKKILLPCAVICCSVPIAYSFCGRLWQFYLFAFINGLAINGLTMMTVGVLVERGTNNCTGAAMGASFAGVGVFSFLMLPLLEFIISNYGWQWSYRAQGAAGFAVLLPTIFFLVRGGRHKPVEHEAEKGTAFADAVKTVDFRALFLGLFCANFVNLALYNHAIPHLTDAGFDAMTAATVSSAAALLMTATKPAFGRAADRLGLKAAALLLGAFLLSGSLAALALNRCRAVIFLYPLLLACCACANAIPGNIFAIGLYGRKDYARISARLTMASSAGSAGGVALAGLWFDYSKSYDGMWQLCAVLSLAASGMLFFPAGKNKKSTKSGT